MSTGIPNLDSLTEDPNPLESFQHWTRYAISESDQETFSLDAAEWFCDDCGEQSQPNCYGDAETCSCYD